MTFHQFESSLEDKNPSEGLSKTLLAMWHAGRGDWDKAHDIAQDIHTHDGSWIHAYLHRWEGDEWNANYWYRRAGKSMPGGSLKDEWGVIVGALLGFEF